MAMETTAAAPGRLAIRCVRPDLTDDRERDERQMTAVGVRLGYAVDEVVVIIDPSREGPLTTVMNALARTKADAVIVPDLDHIDGIDKRIRERAQLITVVGEEMLARARNSGAQAPA